MIFLVPYAYDRMPGGKPRERVPPNRLGSKARIDALLEIVEQPDTKYRFIVTAGFTKESPARSSEKVPESIAAQMRQYIVSKCGCPVWIDSIAWGTYEETREAIEKVVLFLPSEPPEFYVSTNLGHMPRVWLCWFFLKPKSWKVRFVRARHSFTFWPEYFQETAKFFQYLYRFVFKKW